jgi:hypothetical protein
MEFVAYIGQDKENWGQVKALMNRLDCDKMFIVKDKNADGFPTNPKTQIISVDSTKPLVDLKENILRNLKEKLSGDFEVLLSLASGNGKEHMALISALLSVPVGIRLVVFTQKGIEYIN